MAGQARRRRPPLQAVAHLQAANGIHSQLRRDVDEEVATWLKRRHMQRAHGGLHRQMGQAQEGGGGRWPTALDSREGCERCHALHSTLSPARSTHPPRHPLSLWSCSARCPEMPQIYRGHAGPSPADRAGKGSGKQAWVRRDGRQHGGSAQLLGRSCCPGALSGSCRPNLSTHLVLHQGDQRRDDNAHLA